MTLGAAAAGLAVVAVAVAATGGGSRTAAVASDAPAPANTAPVQRGRLSAVVSQDGTLTYRARPDGSPYTVVNQARGVYTALPSGGDEVRCGQALYRVDDRPVLLLCGTIPAYRALRAGDRGRDVRQLNRNLHLSGDVFTVRTARAVRKRVHHGGALALGDAVFLPEPVWIAAVTAAPGAAARPGAPVLTATSDRLHVQVSFDPSDQGAVRKGDRAEITLPGNVPAAGRVEGFGRVAQAPAGPGAKPADATIPTFISLDDPARAHGLARAPVGVDITTEGIDDALSVPVTALVGRSGGGFAVEVAGAGGRRTLVAVRLGLFDTAGGRVQVAGALRAGDAVVVPSP